MIGHDQMEFLCRFSIMTPRRTAISFRRTHQSPVSSTGPVDLYAFDDYPQTNCTGNPGAGWYGLFSSRSKRRGDSFALYTRIHC